MTKALRHDGKRNAKVIAEAGDHEGKFKLLVLDIETAPNLAYVWGMWDQNVGLNQVKEWSSVICFAARWVGSKKVLFHSDFHDGHDNMIQAAWDLIDEADAIVHYNGKGFDIKHLNREFLLAGLNPPRPHKDIDLLQVARQRFKFPSNKLDHVSQALGVGSKVKHEGMGLWLKCMAGDAKAWARMKKYNVGDIAITEAVYKILLPWIKQHPHVGLYTGDRSSCPKCGSMEHVRRGFARTPAMIYQQWQCKTCGGYFRGKGSLPDAGSLTRNSV